MPLFERLYNFAHWLTQDRQEAEDLVQETYAKALKGFSSFQQGTNFRAWIYQILRNTFLTSRTGLKSAATVPSIWKAAKRVFPRSTTHRRASCSSVRTGSSCRRLWVDCPCRIAKCCSFVNSKKCRIRKFLQLW